MKKLMYALLLPLVVVSGLVFANYESKNENFKKPGPKTKKAEAANFVFRSTDGGQTWQDISKGLPANLWEEGIRGDNIFANDKGLFLRVGNGLYYNTPAATFPFWAKANFPYEPGSVALGRSRLSAHHYWGVNLITTGGKSIWSPMFENLGEPRIRSVFETAGGTIFIGIDRGILRFTDGGKTWKQVYAGGWVGHLAESDGVLLATSRRKIIRSTDNGENWAPAISEENVTFDVKPIKGGFVAITSTSDWGTRRLSTSYDGGKTWQPIDAGVQGKDFIDSLWRTWNDRPQVQAFMTSITQVGEAFYCTHPGGIFRSSDKGKTWQLLLPSLDDKSFGLFVSGNVIYAVRSRGGC